MESPLLCIFYSVQFWLPASFLLYFDKWKVLCFVYFIPSIFGYLPIFSSLIFKYLANSISFRPILTTCLFFSFFLLNIELTVFYSVQFGLPAYLFLFFFKYITKCISFHLILATCLFYSSSKL